MNINITKTNFSLTDAISDYVTKKLEPIAELVADDPAVQCDIELSRTTNHHNKGDIYRAELHITGKDKDLYAACEEEDLYKAIDMVKDEMLEEVKTAKEKKITQERKGGIEAKNIIKGIEE